MQLYNTLSKTKEEVVPHNGKTLSFYACGPTVYDFTHIGHIRSYIYNDLIRRVFPYLGIPIKHVMNITDVGHLSDDADWGEDKMEKGARKYGKTVWEVAQFYTDFFFNSMKVVNVLPPHIVSKATDHISEMIDLIRILVQKGHAYETKEAVYFDVTTFKDYGKLSGQNMEEKMKAVRDEVYVDPEKKHPADFSLWFKRVGKFKDHTMHWESPWGDGFPGWHIECSAMSMKYLGKTIDLHTGGLDHIPVHHENEIAQSEAASGVPFVKHWTHFYFLQVDGQKMSKSLGNFYTIEDVQKHNIHPLALRFLFLQSHYRQTMNFTWQSAESADISYKKLKQLIQSLSRNTNKEKIESEQAQKYKRTFVDALVDDLQMPLAIATLWTMIKDTQLPDYEKIALIKDFDQVLGLDLLKDEKKATIPPEIILLAEERKKLKEKKEYSKADSLRKQIEEKGFTIKDSKDGYVIE